MELTEKEFDKKRGYYGTIGDRCVIKDCNIIKDVSIGTDAYLKGANKLKNLTINSDKERSSQIGEGCEMVNGIIGLRMQNFLWCESSPLCDGFTFPIEIWSKAYQFLSWK